MAQQKTVPTRTSVTAFLNAVSDERRRKDGRTLLKLMREVTGEKPVMWGPSIIGFGKYHYRYASGHEGDCCLTGFSPRKQALSIYVMAGCETFPDLMQKLGKYKTGKCCLYVKSLDDIDLPTLKALIRKSVQHVQQRYPG
jgi:hypothetical protein